jgi:hypothetical protein
MKIKDRDRRTSEVLGGGDVWWWGEAGLCYTPPLPPNLANSYPLVLVLWVQASWVHASWVCPLGVTF